jgi:hypothetical protein
MLFSCKSTKQNELENIRKSIENFDNNENIEKIIEYFDNNDIQYSLLRRDDIENIEINKFVENNNKIIFCIYYVDKTNNLINIIKETYYIVYIIFGENDKLKEIIFDELYLGI